MTKDTVFSTRKARWFNLNCERIKKTAKKGFLPSLAGLFFCLIMNSELKNIKKLIVNQSLELDCGKIIKNFPLDYETYGTLNKNKDNAILAFHALTGDQFCTNTNPITKREGWWATAVGPGKAIDTNKYFVICANVLGGCMGS